MHEGQKIKVQREDFVPIPLPTYFNAKLLDGFQLNLALGFLTKKGKDFAK